MRTMTTTRHRLALRFVVTVEGRLNDLLWRIHGIRWWLEDRVDINDE